MNHTPDPVIGIFNHALGLTPEERVNYLSRLGAADGEMRGRVEELLRAYDGAGNFLMEPAAVLHSTGPDTPPAGERPGDRVGPYKLLRQIGEGGCGIIFMALQEAPIRRRVALKLIKPGMDTRSVIARFEAERQALALMDHPGIAKVFDAGVTVSGRPYFVMELIRGVKITEFCDLHVLTTKERLELFVQVCQAVQHAHQKGIIHRDLKPSNILVTRTSEATALPVIIDFGVAKAVASQRLTDKTFLTAYEMLIGTPAYMSPEQAALTNGDVDTRSDVYSLGALLYELLTGQTPFDTARLLRTGLDEARRVIREQEPARPSARLSHMTDNELARVAGHRRENASGLIRTIHGDLDWIVMRALEKDRARRYQTAHGLGMDVRRYQAGDAISARPPGRLYRFRKLVRRNRLIFICLAAAALLLTVSLGMVCASLGNERAARHEADFALRQARAGKESAETEGAKSRQIIRFLEDMLQGVEPAAALGQDTTMLQGILDRTAERVGSELAGQPIVEAEMRGVIGRLYSEIGNYEAAGRMFLAELALRRSLSGPDSSPVAAVLHHFGNLCRKQQDLPRGEAAFMEALAIRRRLSAGGGAGEVDLARTLTGLGAIYCRQRRFEEAEMVIREGLEIRGRLFGGEHLEVADSLRNLGILLADVGRREEAEKAAREMLAIRRRLLGGGHPLVASALMDVAWAAGFTRNSPELENMETEAFIIRRQVLGDGHPEVAKSIYALGGRMRDRGKLEEAHAVLSAALSIQRNLLGPEHPDVLATLKCLAGTLEKEGRWAEAETVWRETLESWRKKISNNNGGALDALHGLVRALIGQRNYADAERRLDEALTPEFVRHPDSAGLLMQRVEILGRQQKWRKAMQDAVLVVGHRPDDPYRYHQLAGLLAVTGEIAAYRAHCRRLCAAFAAKADDPYIAERAAGDCLALPDSGVDLNLMDQLAARAVETGHHDGGMDYFAACKALADYRLGRYSEAAVRADTLLSHGDSLARAKAMAVSAMAHSRLGRPGAARARLDQGNLLAPKPPDGAAADLGNSWLAWLFARLLLDEAESMLSAAAPPKSDPAPPPVSQPETVH